MCAEFPSHRHTHPPRALLVCPVRSEAPAWSRMRRGFAARVTGFWHDRLTDHGRDLALNLIAVPGLLITGTVLAMMLAPIVHGIPA